MSEQESAGINDSEALTAETAAPEVEVPEVETPEVETPEIEAPVLTVGQRLRAARDEARLSIADVAQSLKYSARQIELIEADNYAALPGNTVVRGFTRSYARLLKLDPDELVHLLDTRTPVITADVRPPDNMGIASDAGTERQLTPVLSLAIVVGLAAALLGIWHVWGPETRPAPAAPVSPPTEVVASPAADTVQPPADERAEPAAVPGSEPAPPVVASSSRTGLLFVFEDRSWLEVSDARKQVLHTGENLAGTRLSLDGKPPFEIVVGNAGKVKLTYGEREIDLAPHTRADVARFTLE